MAEVLVHSLTVKTGHATLVRAASFNLSAGELVIIIGENGAGKSSLMRAMAGYLPVTDGQCLIDGQDIARLKPAERAKLMAWLPQSPAIAWPIRVRDAVALGRFPHGTVPWKLAPTDASAIDKAMTDCDLDYLVDRSITTLSGGELARVHIARALACDVPVLLADEPVAALDPRHQLSVMQLLRDMTERGASALVILHDLALAARFADRIIGMKRGEIIIDDNAVNVISPVVVRELFGVDVSVNHDSGWPQPVLLG